MLKMTPIVGKNISDTLTLFYMSILGSVIILNFNSVTFVLPLNSSANFGSWRQVLTIKKLFTNLYTPQNISVSFL